MSQTLGDAMHRVAGDVGALGDIDRALREVRTRRIRITVGTVAAACLTLLLVVLALPTPASIEPIGPEPTPTSPPVEVLRPSDEPMLSIAEAPLPNGADVAVVADGRAVVWADGAPRLVGTGYRTANEPFGFNDWWPLLSPDGRNLLVTDGGGTDGGGDGVVVTDLTTGDELLRGTMQLDGESARVVRSVWSGDSQRLLLVLIPSSEILSDPVPPGVLRVWQRQGDALVPVGQPENLPGTLIGVDADGRTALAVDEQREDGTLTYLFLEHGSRWPALSGSDYPTHPEGWGLGQGCWDPAANRVCGIDEGGPGLFVHVGVLDADMGGLTWRTSALQGLARFAGWRDGDPVLLLPGVKATDGMGVTDTGMVQVVRVTEGGPVVLRQFDASQLPKGQEISYRISVPVYR